MAGNLFRTEALCFKGKITYPDMIIKSGKITFITGESGCGKSTLLKLFNASIAFSCGNVFYNEQPISELDTLSLRREVLLVSQDVFLFNCSIKDNYKNFYSFRGLDAPDDEKIIKMLEICRLYLPPDTDCTKMSGGERQRLYISIFLSFMPKVIMLDKPTSALDEKNTYDVIVGVLDFCKNNSIEVIVVTHEKELTEAFGQEIIRL